MNTYLQAVGWWNFGGSVFLLGLLNESFGKKLFNEWTKIFRDDYKLDYFGKFWCFWAIGLNVFFGIMNIMSVHWGHQEVMRFILYVDLSAYLIFIFLAIWGQLVGRCGPGIWSVYVVFAVWLGWGTYSLFQIIA